jgi:predicted RND superfamily exporter protein
MEHPPGMTRLSGVCLARPRVTLLLGLLITTLAASGLPLLELRTDGEAIYPVDNPVIEQSNLDEKAFRDPRQALVLVSAKAGGPPVASVAGFRFLKELDRELRILPVVRARGVRSLATLLDPDPSLSALQSVKGYLDEVPANPAEIPALWGRIRRHPLAEGLFLSPDGSAAVLYAPISQDLARSEVVATLERWAGTHAASAFDLRLTGPMMAEVLLGRKVLGDLAWTIPLMILVIASLLWGCLRTPGAVVVVLVEVSVVLVCVLGIMGYAGMPVTLVTTILPVILLVMSVADEIHVL